MTNSIGLILAAGRGSRMGSHTDDKPKCLTHLSGYTLLEWQIESMKRAGVDKIYAVGGYRNKDLEKYIEVKFINDDWQTTNMVWSLYQASSLLKKYRCIISYSDIVYHPDIPKALLACPDSLAITYDTKWQELWAARFDNPLDDAESFKIQDRKVVEIGRNTDRLEEIQGQFMGLIGISPKIWPTIEALLSEIGEKRSRSLDMTNLLQLLLDRNVSLTGLPIKGRWCEVDTQSDWSLYNSWSHSTIRNAHDWRWEGRAV